MSEKIPFESPIKVKVGADNMLRTVNSVQGACEVLIDWPHARRGPYYQSAREAFAALAAHAGVLAD